MRPLLHGCAILVFFFHPEELAADRLEVSVTPEMRQYCHVVRFPSGWIAPSIKDEAGRQIFEGFAEYEFRTEGELGAQFLISKFARVSERPFYSKNKYKIDLSDPGGTAAPTTAEVWDNSAVVPLYQNSIFVYQRSLRASPGKLTKDGRVEFRGFQYSKTGELWAGSDSLATRLSPDQSWLALQSSTGKYNERNHKVFWDIFATGSGMKLLTIKGSYSGYDYEPSRMLEKCAWVTERYFIIPLGERLDRCLVCEFGKKQGANR